MRKKLFVIASILVLLLACNYITGIPAATATPTPGKIHQLDKPTLTPSPTPLLPAYIPPACANQPLATVPAANPNVTETPYFPENENISAEMQKKVFEQTVEIIDQVYVDPNFNGKDWNEIKERYKAQIDDGLDTESFYYAMQSMVYDLGDEHSAFLSPIAVAASEDELAGDNEFVGIGIIILPYQEAGLVSILSIIPDSPAEKGGLEIHDNILAVDGLPAVKEETIYMSHLRGPECSLVRVTVQTPGEQPRDLIFVRQRLNSPAVVDARLVATTDGSQIGYIFLPTFFDETIPDQVEKALEEFGPLDGLILDNRMNSGGISTVLESLLSRFSKGALGKFRTRDDSQSLKIYPDPIHNSDTVPLVVLVGEGTASFGEIFSGILQDTGRAKIVGRTTDGNVEILYGYTLDDDSELWIAQATFDPIISHADWEETGIIPDVEAYDDWYKFTFETDPSILAAVELLGHK